MAFSIQDVFIWYEWKDSTWKKHHFGEAIKHNMNLDGATDSIIIQYAPFNIQATLKAEGKLTFPKFWSQLFGWEEPLFCEENLASHKGYDYIFKTKRTDLWNIASLDEIGKLPPLLKKYVDNVPEEIKELAESISKEKDIAKVLYEFYEFVSKKVKILDLTTGKPPQELFEEYRKKGYFEGNCKEVSNFYKALCNAKGLPAKKIQGIIASSSGHVSGHIWTIVCVPTKNIKDGYAEVDVDPSMLCFNTLSLDHIYSCTLPEAARKNLFAKKPSAIELKIEEAEKA